MRKEVRGEVDLALLNTFSPTALGESTIGKYARASSMFGAPFFFVVRTSYVLLTLNREVLQDIVRLKFPNWSNLSFALSDPSRF